MMKVGICTLYYRNRNYGANLQAYALREVLASFGNDTEVVTYYNNTKLHGMLSLIKQILKKRDSLADIIKLRNAMIDRFNESIPHSRVFYSNTINKANDEYDCFITGSDQVWNPDWINRYMSLEFVDNSKVTASYAASIGKVELNDVQKKKLKIALDHTKYISIREKDSIRVLQELTDKEVEYVLDPTLLLKVDEWNKICSERIIQEEYIMCYFLGGNENLRKVAREYAKARNLKLVTLPYLNAAYRKVDDGFGDHALYEISPNDFLSLIKHASFVMTDSFHAAVFSHLYERAFVVSGNKEDQMGCRMKSLVELFGTEERFFKDHSMVTLEKLEVLERNPLVLDKKAFETMRQKSLKFLKKVVNDD